MGEFQRIRPFKILSVVMVTIAVVLTVVSLAGPDWVTASFYEGDVKSWGLWWDCLKVHTSFEMCLSADWLAGCAALVFLSLIADVIGAALGIWGLISKRRMPYILAGTVCVISCVCMVVSLIIYPVMFTNEVTSNADYNAETSDFEFSWTFGVACGTVFFLMGAAIFFFIRVTEEEDAQPMKSVQDKSYYSVN
ncbi:p53 apoptosis effector related to PMP-22 [Biomphalaria pfeifferi]|uniref:P53 apoptosis effector related to PMP-22 n=1 Tax=Biomphalaria pfeifferi TaxID=112525 RepID=A0AAD8BMD0_BIOPF|nr:p53 apoptosis effector related to PMP-22 [Biomphalaria pfeifferi]